MQTDFHYYAVYALCRLAGYKEKKALDVAYSSQCTDDADDGRSVQLEDGALFNPTMTAYSALRPGNLTATVQRDVYLAFHFLPSVDPESEFDGRDRRNLETGPDCALARRLVRVALADESEHQSQLLGLALHSYADTFAHQGFSGFCGPENDVEDIRVRNNRNPVTRFFRLLWHKVMEAILPAIGHAEVGHLADMPFRQWEYYDYSNHQPSGNIDNTARCLQAAEKIYEFLGGEGWADHAPLFEELFSFEGNLAERCVNWERALRSGFFGFKAADGDDPFRYDEELWRNQAMEKSAKGKNTYGAKDGFDTSRWVLFHAAARAHRTTVGAQLKLLASKGLEVRPGAFLALTNKLTFALARLFRIETRKSFSFKWFRRGVFRYVVYGAFMLAGEVSFYSLVKIGRRTPDFLNWLFKFEWCVDPRLDLGHVWEVPIKSLYGQASLWMFLVYATIGLFGIEPAYKHMRKWRWPWWARGLIYMFIILAMECATGWALLWGTGLQIWYYADAYDILTYTSWAIAPFWFILGLLSENFVLLVIKYSEKKVKLRSLEIG